MFRCSFNRVAASLHHSSIATATARVAATVSVRATSEPTDVVPATARVAVQQPTTPAADTPKVTPSRLLVPKKRHRAQCYMDARTQKTGFAKNRTELYHERDVRNSNVLRSTILCGLEERCSRLPTHVNPYGVEFSADACKELRKFALKGGLLAGRGDTNVWYTHEDLVSLRLRPQPKATPYIIWYSVILLPPPAPSTNENAKV